MWHVRTFRVSLVLGWYTFTGCGSVRDGYCRSKVVSVKDSTTTQYFQLVHAVYP